MAEAEKKKPPIKEMHKNAIEAIKSTVRKVQNFEKPIYIKGKVVKGFQRGREMNCRTANLEQSSYTDSLLNLPQGVYWTLARRADSKSVYKSVSSWGNNPSFKNVPNTLEVHILHDFDEDFYEEDLEVLVCGFMRPMWAFQSMEALEKWIDDDKKHAHDMLELQPCLDMRDHFEDYSLGRTKL